MLLPSRGDLQFGNYSGHFVCALVVLTQSINFIDYRCRFTRALEDQPQYALLPSPYATLVPALLFIIGQTFVITSTWALGITGTFLGDYFGILLDDRVEGFPFNVVENPMYIGSTICFVAGALWWVNRRVSPIIIVTVVSAGTKNLRDC